MINEIQAGDKQSDMSWRVLVTEHFTLWAQNHAAYNKK